VLVLAQALCLMRVVCQNVECEVGVGNIWWGGGVQAITSVDTISLLPLNTVIMQLSDTLLSVYILPSPSDLNCAGLIVLCCFRYAGAVGCDAIH
jgi:hypothetical protein